MFGVCDVYMDPDEMGERYKVMAIAPRRKDGLFFLDSVEETTRKKKKKKKKKGDAVSVCRQVEQSGQNVVKDETERRATPLGRSMKSCIAVKTEEVDLSFKSNQATRQARPNRGGIQRVQMRNDRFWRRIACF